MKHRWGMCIDERGSMCRSCLDGRALVFDLPLAFARKVSAVLTTGNCLRHLTAAWHHRVLLQKLPIVVIKWWRWIGDGSWKMWDGSVKWHAFRKGTNIFQTNPRTEMQFLNLSHPKMRLLCYQGCISFHFKCRVKEGVSFSCGRCNPYSYNIEMYDATSKRHTSKWRRGPHSARMLLAPETTHVVTDLSPKPFGKNSPHPPFSYTTRDSTGSNRWKSPPDRFLSNRTGEQIDVATRLILLWPPVSAMLSKHSSAIRGSSQSGDHWDSIQLCNLRVNRTICQTWSLASFQPWPPMMKPESHCEIRATGISRVMFSKHNWAAALLELCIESLPGPELGRRGCCY